MVSNRPPAAKGSIPALPPLDVGASAHEVDVAAYFTDPDGDTLTYQAASSDESVATVSTTGSIVSVTARAKGAATVTVTATDPDDLTATQEFQVTVKNRPPATQGSIPAPPLLDAGAAAHPVDVAAYFSDPDGDALTYQARSSKESVATVNTTGSRVTVTPVAQGAATITVTAADSGGLSAEQRFTVTVRASRPPPVQTPNRPPAAQGSIPAPPPLDAGASAHEVDVAAYFTDPDGDPLTYQARSSKKSVATVNTTGSRVTITPVAQGAATITVTAADSGGLSAEQRFTVTVRAPRPPPVQTPNRAPAAQGSIPPPPPLDAGGADHPVDVAAYFSDPDDDPLTYQARSSKVSVATANTTGSTVSVTPVAKGAATITVTATDPGNLTASQQFQVTVKNRPPQPQGSIPAPPPLDAGASAHDVDVAAYFTDPDGDTLTYQAASSDESVATVSTTGSIVSVTPVAKGAATITVTATDTGNLTASQRFQVTVREATPAQPPQPIGSLELESLTVTGGGAMYPAFAAEVRHYAVRCSASTTLRVRAQASRAGARVTLLRADAGDNQAATGAVDASVAVNGDHDVVVEVSDGADTVRYVVHCLPASFPDIRVVGGTGQASDGFLLVTPTYGGYHDETTFLAILDNNGVPRFHRLLTDSNFWALDFKPHGSGRYSVARRPELNLEDSVFGNWEIDLLDARLRVTSTVRVAPPLTQTDGHDFQIAADGDYLLLSYRRATRDFSELASDLSVQVTRDSVIQRRNAAGTEEFSWNSWDHRDVLQVGADCRVGVFPDTYAHANSLQLLANGDIVTSLRGCAQILRIDGTTGAVKWKLGGTPPPEDSDTEYLEIVSDAAGEFCGQHHVTLTASNTVVLFDNGVQCLGPRKSETPFSRAVEYDLASGTRAVFRREFRLPDKYGYFPYTGGVSVYGSRWLISWGQNPAGRGR